MVPAGHQRQRVLVELGVEGGGARVERAAHRGVARPLEAAHVLDRVLGEEEAHVAFDAQREPRHVENDGGGALGCAGCGVGVGVGVGGGRWEGGGGWWEGGWERGCGWGAGVV